MSQMSTRVDTEGDQSRKRKWWKEHRDRKRALQIPREIHWGSYNLEFPTFGKSGIAELKRFIQALDKESQPAKTRADIIRDVMTQLRTSNRPLEIIARIPSILPTSGEDIITLEDSQALYNRLGEKFDKPLLHRAESGDSLSGRKLRLDSFWIYLREDPQKMVDVYDCSVENPLQRTYQMTVHEVLAHWERPAHERHALNLLDIENRLVDFCPYEILQRDLSQRILRKGSESIGKTNSSFKRIRQEFFLLSGSNAISSIHVDNASQLTWILILEGRKIWYFPRKLSPNAVRWLALMGSQNVQGYEGGWARVELRAGDLLVLPPSCPHAVFTPDDCLAVGGHFFTAAHLGTTLCGLKHQEDCPEICNEDLDPTTYSLLGEALNHFDTIGTYAEQVDVLTCSSLFLDTLNPTPIAAFFKKIRPKHMPRDVDRQYSKVISQLEARLDGQNHLISARSNFLDELMHLRKRLVAQWENE
ncbi:hypothetical protein BDV59DRAFT_162914 [Aspergillus ambiguus]|uniref:uncharacterized protein n=1 Tax=Aspergillus ambiguus TaxID=176160 RepID=UPI003CCDBF67